MDILEWFLRRIRVASGSSPSWPLSTPVAPGVTLAQHWEQVQEWRRRARNKQDEMLQHAERWNANPDRRSLFTPVPIAKEMSRLSAALLFSDPPKITLDEDEEGAELEPDKVDAAGNPVDPDPLDPEAVEEADEADEDRDEEAKKLAVEAAKAEGKADATAEDAPPVEADPMDPAGPDTPEVKPRKPKKSPRQKLLDELLELNGVEPFLQEAAEQVAVEGRGAIRVIRDEEVAEGKPFLTYVPEDQIIWDVRHGRAIVGAICVFEYIPLAPDGSPKEIYRMLEEHKAGTITRKVHRGTVKALGNTVPSSEWPEEWKGTLESIDTGLDVPTIIRWDNVPGGHSDIDGLDKLLDNLNEAESLMLDKGRKSIPIVFADRSLADDNGNVDLEGVVLTGDSNLDRPMGDTPTKTVETSQPDLQTQEHTDWINHVREMIVTHAGYSSATWGMGEEGRTDSGTALQLRQARTLLTRAGKERMAVEAIVNALAVALAWAEGNGRPRKVRDYRPDVTLGTGLPMDPVEKAQELSQRKTAGLVSLRQAIRETHPHWTEEQVDEEIERIEGDNKPPPGLDPRLNPAINPFAPDPENPDEEPELDKDGKPKPPGTSTNPADPRGAGGVKPPIPKGGFGGGG